ncbi:MAG: hypothetical protein KDD99_27685, partial [Bacteroidetes bacterium]|nr:hypothetical protein [Bacteroidota bacterium]
MNKLFSLLTLFLLLACNPPKSPKIPVYAWLGGPGEATDAEIKTQFTDLKNKGIDGLMYNGGQNPETYRRVGKIAKEVGLEFHTWIPTMVQKKTDKIKAEWYGVNGKGESALEK